MIMMMQPQHPQFSWPGCSLIDLHQGEVYPHGLSTEVHMGDFEFSSFLTTTGDYSDVSSIPCFQTIYSDEIPLQNLVFPTSNDDFFAIFTNNEFELNPDELGLNPNGFLSHDELKDVSGWIEENSDDLPSQHQSTEESSMSSSTESNGMLMDGTSIGSPLVCPSGNMEVDNQLSILHLLEAYGEALEKGFMELAEVIVRRVSEKVSPVGMPMERVGYYLFQGLDKQNDYLKQEAIKNYAPALNAYCQVCPYSRFAHFTANMAILEAMPRDVETIHIVDFDTREGVQWASLLKNLGHWRAVRVTSINWNENCGTGPQRRSEETQKRLSDYAESLGIQFKIDEMDIKDILREQRTMKRMRGRKEFLAFNCVVGLPTIGLWSRRHVTEFLRAAKELLSNSSSNCINSGSTTGIITFANGDGIEMSSGNNSGFGSFFEGCLQHFHALFESMDSHFPAHLSLARTAIECLFVAPCISSPACFRKWEERQEAFGLPSDVKLQGWRMSKENIAGAKEMVRGEEGLYEVTVGGENENTMILEWRGTPLVTVSSWI